MWPLSRPAGAGLPIPARPAALAGRERAGEGGGGSRVRFRCLDGVEMAGGGVRNGRRRWPPLEQLVRRGGAALRRGGTSVGCGRCQGPWGMVGLVPSRPGRELAVATS
jgi:hypothetical protein